MEVRGALQGIAPQLTGLTLLYIPGFFALAHAMQLHGGMRHGVSQRGELSMNAHKYPPRKYLYGRARMTARLVTTRASAKATAPQHVWLMGRRARVLVAEDDAAMRDLIASDLRREGYEVVVASSAEELFARIGRIAVRGGGAPESIAVIISDIRMPGLSGMDVLSAVRGASWKTPVILITAFGSEEIHREAEELGAHAVLDKPFAMERLRDLVRQTVNRC